MKSPDSGKHYTIPHIGLPPLYSLKQKNEPDPVRFLSDLPVHHKNFTFDDRYVQRWLKQDLYPGGDTCYQEVKRVNPGITFTLSAVDPVVSRARAFKTFEAAYEAYDLLMDDILREHVEKWPLHQIGCTLSGGLDSTHLALRISRIVREKKPDFVLPTYSLFGESGQKPCDLPYIEAALKTGRFSGKMIDIDAEPNPFSPPSRGLQAVDEPMMIGNWFLTEWCYREAEKDGIRYLVEGLGGDAILPHGREQLQPLLLRGEFAGYASAFRRLYGYDERPTFGKWLWGIWKFGLRPPVKMAMWKLLPPYRAKYLDPVEKEYWKQLGINAVKESKNWYFRMPEWVFRSAWDRYLFQLKFEGASYKYSDFHKIANAYNLEPVYPFHDMRIVRFFIGIIQNPHIEYPYSRPFTRTIFKDEIPALFHRNDKGDFSPIFHKFTGHGNTFRHYIEITRPFRA